jgi:hypothetical protein
MNTKLALLVSLFLITIFSACKKEASIGQWRDVIQLSGKNFVFNSTGDSIWVTAKGHWWAINCVALDTTKINVYSSANDPCNFTYTDSNIKLISINCDSLFIKMNANHSSLDRVLSFGFYAGDYRDGIKITQTKN